MTRQELAASQPTIKELRLTVHFLDATAWREFRGPLQRTGWNEAIHLATIAEPSGATHRCFVKPLPQSELPSLLCEALGWVLAGCAGLARASFAAIVVLDVDRLRQSMALGPEFDGMQYCPAWCSEAIAGRSVGPQPTNIQMQAAGTLFLRSQDARKMAAFDIWSDLKDRNFGNVIRLQKGGYASIDHETMLYDMLWKPTKESFASRSLVDTAVKAFQTSEADVFKQHVALAAEGKAQNGVKKGLDHAGAIVAAKFDIDSIIQTMIRDDDNPDPAIVVQKAAEATAMTLTIESYLQSRGIAGWMANTLGVIV